MFYLRAHRISLQPCSEFHWRLRFISAVRFTIYLPAYKGSRRFAIYSLRIKSGQLDTLALRCLRLRTAINQLYDLIISEAEKVRNTTLLLGVSRYFATVFQKSIHRMWSKVTVPHFLEKSGILYLSIILIIRIAVEWIQSTTVLSCFNIAELQNGKRLCIILWINDGDRIEWTKSYYKIYKHCLPMGKIRDLSKK